jgi:Bacterial Ig-like domain (group 3)
VAYATEKSLKLTATVKGLFDGTPSGKVVITTGKTTICTIAKLSGGKGTCSPASNTLLKTGTYTLTATYRGNLATSRATAKLTVTPNHSTSTTLKLSATTITYGHEKSLKLTATATAIYGGTLTGKIVITAGSKTICTITTLVKGTGTCGPASNTLLRAGTYKLVATYTGNYASSKSKEVTLTIKS